MLNRFPEVHKSDLCVAPPLRISQNSPIAIDLFRHTQSTYSALGRDFDDTAAGDATSVLYIRPVFFFARTVLRFPNLIVSTLGSAADPSRE